MDLKKNMNSESKSEIKLNRKMRMWHKYKNYCITAGGLLAVLIVCIVVFKSCAGGKKAAPEVTTPVQTTVAQQGTTAAQGTDQPQESTAQETTSAASAGGVYTVSGKAAEQEFTSKDALASAVFLGDSIFSGISYYGYLDEAQVIAEGNMTSDKALDYVDRVLNAVNAPEKVFIMVGLNDANYGTRGADAVVDYISQVVARIKEARPALKVYVVSVLPVTQAFEAKTTVKVKQSLLDEINQKLSAQAGAMNAGYIDIAGAFKDGTGYLNPSYTGNGSSINNAYYPFLLNSLAEAAKG